MRTGRLFLMVIIVAAIMTTVAFKALTGQSEVQSLRPQTISEGGVNITVTPKNVSGESLSWDFEVSLSTHTGSLSQDLNKTSALIDSEGKEYAPIGWEGDPPGGHHRKGVLRFKPLSRASKTLELRITGVGGVGAQVFRWKLD